jgi:UDP-3-O-[3-hydroxymyristoyl] glucosamine N-acyltransferase
MEFTAAQIAGFLQGTVEGNPEEKVSNVSKIDQGKPGTLTFLANPKYTSYIYSTKASVIVVNADFSATRAISGTLIRVADAYSAFAALMEMFDQSKSGNTGISSLASIAPSAKLGENVSVGEFSVIGNNVVIGDNVLIHPLVYIGNNVTIGDNTLIYPGVRIYHDSVIGKHCTLHAGVVIGCDGLAFAMTANSNYKKIPQLGNVILEDNIDIGANTTIDRATLGSTIIRKGVKLNNLIMVGHNAEIGENTIIAAQTGISGSTKIGKNCMIGGQVGIIGHITIADGVKIAPSSGIEASITKEGAVMLGVPTALEISKARRNYIHWRNLDEIVRKVYAIEKQLNKHCE